ncbi:MAG: hypothetical protein IBX72_01725 [Nitrospirae bacterium]|jgi:hypothetical protein|nr:hypothetical protein [Nitrospirota bacterium]
MIIRISLSVFFLSLTLCLPPSLVQSEIIVYDTIALKEENIMLKAETRGKFFRKGGEVVEFFVDRKSIGRTLSGGDGFAYKQFKPFKTGIHHITLKSGEEEGNGLLLSLKKGDRIIFVDMEGSLLEEIFTRKPRKESQETIRKLSEKFPVVFLQTGLLGVKVAKTWLKENGFVVLPVISWRGGLIFDEITEMGLKIKALTGSAAVIESAKIYKPRAFSFEDVEGAEMVNDWEEIERKLR